MLLFLNVKPVWAHCTSTRSQPTCSGGGYTYTSEVYTEVYTFQNLYSPESECKKTDPKPIEHKIIVQKLDQMEALAQSLSSDSICKDVNKYAKDYLRQAEQVRRALISANNLRKEMFFTNIENKKATDGTVTTIDPSQDKEGLHTRSHNIAGAAILCGISDMSQKLQPVWNLSVQFRRIQNGTYPISQRMPEICFEKMQSVNYLVESTFDTAEQIYKNLWMGNVCTEKHYRELLGEFGSHSNMRNSVVKHGDCEGENCENLEAIMDLLASGEILNSEEGFQEFISQGESMNLKKTRFIEYEDKRQENSKRRTYYDQASLKDKRESLLNSKEVITSLSSQPDKNSRGLAHSPSNKDHLPVFPNGYYDFVKNKGWYCQTQNDDLFSTISRRYCLSAFPILLKKSSRASN
ncbi:MAG: hypothetical protein CME65_02490 [Halobacteriovoraceae bacterium]|nr:hypothetical protein [Halobacteriovoraceae bacterium]|tara:strand:- start:4207 stop:5427 length:1221 start_codon:yes stop_codon:yes gene_type:complete